MKISEAWLREWIATPLTAEELSARLTMAGVEVDQLVPVAAPFEQVIVAKVIETFPHPEADRLTVCRVDTSGDELLQVVCGATNVRPGLVVALALPGAKLPGDVVIKETKLRGQLSQGMLCSLSELCLSEASEGIIELPDEAPLGGSLREYLALDDQVFEIDLTPNRADCFSVLGIARELSALLDTPYQRHESAPVQVNANLLPPKLTLQAPIACPVMAIRIVKGINPEAVTPPWLTERLRRCGLRAQHPVVDVINYVMLELGQPLHAYDLATISGELSLRYATDQENVTLLNGQQLGLHHDTLVMADDLSVHALAGILGDEASCITEKTQDVLLESAYFDPVAIANTARRYSLSSDACTRFERGVDPQLHQAALERVTSMLLEIIGGEAGPLVVVGDATHARSSTVIAFSPSTFVSLTGLTLPDEQMLLILRKLGLQVDDAMIPWQVTVPYYRFDLALAVDLVEEILRVHGYDQLPPAPILAPLKAGDCDAKQLAAYSASQYLAQCGYHEAISYSFVEPTLQRALFPDAEVMTLLNPISSELAEMRVSLWSGLLAMYLYNSHRQQPNLKCFESGIVFDRQADVLSERPVIAGLMAGVTNSCHWGMTARAYDFYDMKGEVEALCAHLKLTIHCKAATHPALHPGQSAQLFCAEQAVGWVGALHPRIAQAMELTTAVYLFELDLSACELNRNVRYQRISKYPHIRRDLSLLVNAATPFAAIEQVMRAVIPAELLKALQLFDQYYGEALPLGKKSMAIALTLQDEHRTLVDEEVNQLICTTLNALNEKLDIVLRD